ncbi:TatA1:sec-independent protein translocase protein [Desulfosarcina variabilis str. Montpellier]|uniref:twin-arginine translocase TatA/TatE family subunit n=1 Tax=Desulfosarcina variabilis TaxID=2300 RepID=UPI003AFA2DA2
MFGIGMPEMILILAVALIVIGPKKLPDLAKSLGRALGEFKKATNELKDSFQIDDELKEVKTTFDDINRDLKGNRPAGTSPAKPDATDDGKADLETDQTTPDHDPVDNVKAAFHRSDDTAKSEPALSDDKKGPAADIPGSDAEPRKG